MKLPIPWLLKRLSTSCQNFPFFAPNNFKFPPSFNNSALTNLLPFLVAIFHVYDSKQFPIQQEEKINIQVGARQWQTRIFSV